MLIPQVRQILIFFPEKRGLQTKVLYPHAVLLRQAFAHCGKFLTAASRRSLGRISVPVWLIILSNQLPIVALVLLLIYQLANQAQAHP